MTSVSVCAVRDFVVVLAVSSCLPVVLCQVLLLHETGRLQVAPNSLFTVQRIYTLLSIPREFEEETPVAPAGLLAATSRRGTEMTEA